MLTLHNTLTKKKEAFQLISQIVGVYSCGPTVYDYIHIGNLRSFLTSDFLLRILKYNGFKTKAIMNITDVDDKTIKNSQKAGKSLEDFTAEYTKAFWTDIADVNIQRPDGSPKATEEIEDMVALIKILMEKGFAYKADNGDIYFSIAKFDKYGTLANTEGLKTNASGRLSNDDEYEKDDVRDFALWKSYTPEDGDVFWETEIGKGRPGWHIECSVMSAKYLGQPFDLHTGGVDLIFPHHTNEIAQSEAAYGKPLANYWIHTEHLLVDNGKMSKSAGNFYTLNDLRDKKINPLAFRYLILSSHYRSKLNFTWDSLQAAQNALNNLYQTISSYSEPKNGLPECEAKFLEAVNDDLNTAKGLAVVWDLIKSDNDSGEKLASLLKFDQVLGLNINEVWKEAQSIPENVRKLLEERNRARDSKDFAASDKIRQQIEQSGYVIEDTPDGSILKKQF